jgi:5-methylcytosine-specific restriction endonuclease McrA
MRRTRRTCITGYGCSDGGLAVPGRSRCRKHGGSAWARQPAARLAAYRDPVYLRNRKITLEREPICHWCRLRPSTTADHLRSVAKGGGHELENLVGSCSKCNERRGGAEGRATMKRRAAARRKEK